MVNSLVTNRLPFSGAQSKMILFISLILISMSAFSQVKTSFIISKSELKESFNLCAIFDEGVSDKILESVNSKLIKNNNWFLKRSTQEKTITLNNSTTFHINFKPGELRIKFRKADNADGWYDILKSRCLELEDDISEASGYSENKSNVKELTLAEKSGHLVQTSKTQ